MEALKKIIAAIEYFVLNRGSCARFTSSEELIQAIKELVTQLEGQGKLEAAKELREGISLLNGLTDGWALLMESLERVAKQKKGLLEKRELSEAKALYREVKRIVYRN